MTITRQPAGQPTGGQFAPHRRPGSGIALVDVDAVEHTRSRLVEATDWEGFGLDRERFDTLLDNITPQARDDAWKWVEYLSQQEEAAHEEDDIPTDFDLVAVTAAASAREATDGIRDEHEWDKEFTRAYFEFLAADYQMTRVEVLQTVAGWQHGQRQATLPRVSQTLPDLAAHGPAVELGTSQAA